MFRVVSEANYHFLDTGGFVSLVNNQADFFDSNREIIVCRAPGRLDLMGGIADYSGSLVLELPIGDATHVGLQLDSKKTFTIISFNADSGGFRQFAISLDKLVTNNQPIDYALARRCFSGNDSWAAYVVGAFLVLMHERGVKFDHGARLLISSSVPEGKGVSSSAALEVATMQAINYAVDLDMSCREIAFLCQKVENVIAGAPCGVMDQMTASCGEADQLLALLCQPGELRGTISLPHELAVWGIDSGIRHSVSGADYGTVRTAAFMGYRMIADMEGLDYEPTEVQGHVIVQDPKWHGYLANIETTDFEERYAPQLPAMMLGRDFLDRYRGITDSVTCVVPDRSYPVNQATRHPVREHHRVSKFAEILQNWDDISQAETLGELMFASHKSYSACGLGSPGTDELVNIVRERGIEAGLFGAKITGGGSGGTVAVLGWREAEAAVRKVADEYFRRTDLEPTIISGSSPSASAFGCLILEDKDADINQEI